MAEGICARARYADLVILGQYEWQRPVESHPLPIAHSVTLRCGRRVLVVPAACCSSTFDRIVVAWDGSREAVRAVHDALPLLKMSRMVQVLILVLSADGDSRTNGDAERLVADLQNHGIPANRHMIALRAGGEHAELSHQIEQGRYDLAVMGAYSHSPWLEFVFGGATQSILSSSSIPVLVSH
jgi:nucleotide-binding universal stress UspA family protein